LGLAFSAFSYLYAAIVLAGGYLVDRFGPRIVIFVCVTFIGIATILTGFTINLTTLILARALLGLVEAPVLPAATRAMAAWFPPTRWGFIQGFTPSCSRIGTTL